MRHAMTQNLMVALRMTAVTLVLTGLAYPLVVTGVAHVVFPWRAGGSFVAAGSGRVVGSTLLGQPFEGSAYFHPRPSAAGAGYDAANSAGSNLGPTSARLRDRARREAAKLRAENPEAARGIPADLLTTSASGLDPHLSPAGVLYQAPRVARARGVEPARVRALVERHVEGRTLAFLGEPRVNVLQLNIDLDRELGKPSARGGP